MIALEIDLSHESIDNWVNQFISILTDGTKPSPEPMLTYSKYGPVTFVWGQFHKIYVSHWQLNQLKNYSYEIHFESAWGQ